MYLVYTFNYKFWAGRYALGQVDDRRTMISERSYSYAMCMHTHIAHSTTPHAYINFKIEDFPVFTASNLNIEPSAEHFIRN